MFKRYSNKQEQHSSVFSKASSKETEQELGRELPPRIYTPQENLNLAMHGSNVSNQNQALQQGQEVWPGHGTSIHPHDEDRQKQAMDMTHKHNPHSESREIKTKEEEPETTLGEGVSFKGELQFQSFLRIDGHFEGSLVSEGKLVIGPKGHVKSHVKLKEAIIEGYLEGNLEVSGRVELRGNAKIYGNICTKSLLVDEGVLLQGEVKVLPHGNARRQSEMKIKQSNMKESLDQIESQNMDPKKTELYPKAMEFSRPSITEQVEGEVESP